MSSQVMFRVGTDQPPEKVAESVASCLGIEMDARDVRGEWTLYPVVPLHRVVVWQESRSSPPGYPESVGISTNTVVWFDLARGTPTDPQIDHVVFTVSYMLEQPDLIRQAVLMDQDGINQLLYDGSLLVVAKDKRFWTPKRLAWIGREYTTKSVVELNRDPDPRRR